MKAILNRCIFRIDLKFSRDDTCLISAGNLFHKVGAATLNPQSPYDMSRDTGTCNSIWLDDLSSGDNFLTDTNLHRYSGTVLLIDLYVIKNKEITSVHLEVRFYTTFRGHLITSLIIRCCFWKIVGTSIALLESQ